MMLKADEDALICDFAETYGILDIWQLPIDLLATLACGLRENSRIQMKFAKIKYPLETLLMAAMLDNTAWLKWSRTKDAEKGVNYPESIFNRLIEPVQGEITFNSGSDFDKAKKEFDEQVQNGRE